MNGSLYLKGIFVMRGSLDSHGIFKPFGSLIVSGIFGIHGSLDFFGIFTPLGSSR